MSKTSTRAQPLTGATATGQRRRPAVDWPVRMAEIQQVWCAFASRSRLRQTCEAHATTAATSTERRIALYQQGTVLNVSVLGNYDHYMMAAEPHTDAPRQESAEPGRTKLARTSFALHRSVAGARTVSRTPCEGVAHLGQGRRRMPLEHTARPLPSTLCSIAWFRWAVSAGIMCSASPAESE